MSRNRFRAGRLTAAFLMLALALSAAACAKKQEATETAQAPPAAEPAPLTDANIAAIVVTANTIDIQAAELAKTKAQSAEVKAFADQMITDHTAVNKQATDLATKLSLTAEENDTSRQLQSNAEATRTTLQGLEGAAFDKAYIDNEVAYHKAVIETLDNSLIPAAQNAELKALLESVRPAFAAHLEHAQRLQTAAPVQ